MLFKKKSNIKSNSSQSQTKANQSVEMLSLFAHGWRNIHELRRQSNGDRSLTRYWSIYSLKLDQTFFLHPPLLSIVFVPSNSIHMFVKFFGGTGKE